MKPPRFLFALFCALTFSASAIQHAHADTSRITMVIHGGAGTIVPEKMTPEKELAYRDALANALLTGYEILAAGGSSLDAVEATIRTMEDSPLFNAGRGAVFTNQGRNEMDASIMEGATLNAGAVASVTGIKNPISAARKLMTASKHVLLVGTGAEAFARENGLEFADSAYFFTQDRWNSLQRAKKAEAEKKAKGSTDEKHGTVGAVALDAAGNIAAGTSTGGLTNKRWGRVGDSPIIGAGTYADNSTCGVSCSGVGEYFIRASMAYDVTAQMRYAGKSLDEAVRHVIHDTLTRMAGENTGGMIALDREGNISMQFNTPGMYRGYIRSDGQPVTLLYLEDGEE